MNRFLIGCLIFLLGCTFNNKKEFTDVQNSVTAKSLDSCVDFNTLNNNIRDGLLTKENALKQVQTLLPKIKSYFYKNGGKDFDKSSWIFPVQGCNSKSIGGTNGSGYIADGYDYFDGNKHKSHPAQDIFIIDRNQDCLSDMTKKPVNVLSISGGIVIASEINWDTTSVLRGGKYIWIYDPASSSFFYYAHNSKVLVHPCDIINPGDTIATVGRTGLNAFKKRSPTHLHFMQLKLDNNNYPKPIDCYKDLILLKTK